MQTTHDSFQPIVPIFAIKQLLLMGKEIPGKIAIWQREYIPILFLENELLLNRKSIPSPFPKITLTKYLLKIPPNGISYKR